MRIAAYVYPGWHPIPERDASFYPGFTEWDLVDGCRPRFTGHRQPRLPAEGWGRYDDRDPREVGRRVALAAAHGIDALIYGCFWCRGKRVFQDALDLGFLGSPEGERFPFAIMWANRMPRRVLPVRRADVPVIEGERLVTSDVDDFVSLMKFLAQRYFTRTNYLRIEGRPYFSIFDTSFFVRELGVDGATRAIRSAREVVDVHFGAIDPEPSLVGAVKEIGFDSVTNYVLLPYWKEEFLQDYDDVAGRRAGEWAGIEGATGLRYFPSVSPGWDSSPRGADFGDKRPDKYPWWPVVVGEHPERFRKAVARAIDFVRPGEDGLVLVASLNEWSEGHYLEPDRDFGMGWLEAIRDAKSRP